MIDPRDDPLDEVADEFRRLPVPDRPDDGPLLARLTRDHRPARTYSPHVPLTSPAVRYVTAAALVLAAAAWVALSPSRPPALAEVIRDAGRHKLVRYQATRTTVDKETGAIASVPTTVYVDLIKPRMREESEFAWREAGLIRRCTTVFDDAKGRILTTTSREPLATNDRAQGPPRPSEPVHPRRTAVVSRMPGVKTAPFPPVNPLGLGRGFLEGLRRLQGCEHVRPTWAEIDGYPGMKYRLTEGDRVTCLWVNTRTKFLTRVEIEVTDPAPGVAGCKYELYDFEWDPEVADTEALFNTDPPAGYALEDRTGVP